MAIGSAHIRARRLSGQKKPHAEAIRADVNITPLVDVVLVLLIIFMVVIPLMARGREVPLPRTRHHSERPDALQPVIALDGNGDLWLDTEKIGPLGPDCTNNINCPILEKLGSLVQRAWDMAKNKDGVGKVYIKVDGNVAYGKVYPLIIAVNQGMAVSSIDLATAELKEEGE